MTLSNQPPPTEVDQELLSAYLDNQLSAAERLTLERRLQQEVVLQAELQELRMVKSLLGELPSLAPPRSFTLDPAKVAPPRKLALFGALRLGSLMATLLLALTVTFDLFGAPATSVPSDVVMQSRQAAQPTLSDASAPQAAPAQPSAEVGVLKAPAASGAAQDLATPDAQTGSDAYTLPTTAVQSAPADAASSQLAPVPTVGASENSSPDTDQTDLPPALSTQPNSLSALRWAQIILAAIALASGLGAVVAWQQRR